MTLSHNPKLNRFQPQIDFNGASLLVGDAINAKFMEISVKLGQLLNFSLVSIGCNGHFLNWMGRVGVLRQLHNYLKCVLSLMGIGISHTRCNLTTDEGAAKNGQQHVDGQNGTLIIVFLLKYANWLAKVMCWQFIGTKWCATVIHQRNRLLHIQRSHISGLASAGSMSHLR